jgi:hypothetical protein
MKPKHDPNYDTTHERELDLGTPTERLIAEDIERPEFSVWEFFPDGYYQPVVRWTPLEEALERAKVSINKPATVAGFITKVLVTDGGDFCVFQWEYGKGIVFPKRDPVTGKFVGN